ncbi:MAG TPA: D-alanyl-D-alanine carboxypeptidase family protein [Paracoccaceae bacterium]|nr:D-alanyl-D-alanine carboxypeptidase family protein [Paracoccaceae bacterium]
MRFPVYWVRAAALSLLIVVGVMGGVPGRDRAQAAELAAIVMDMRDGTVYYTDDADRRQHPASLTKMMTLYLTFEAVRDGRISLDQKFRVSRHASRQPASKLYLKQGQRVSVRHLIRAAAIKSANDAAMVLAEGIGGSQAAFADMMTRKARALGMRNTTFKNPHGLTASGHLSTARDMAILARHLFYDFPEYFNIFSRKSDYAAGKRINTTNRMLSTYRGMAGIKTGYTRAAGHNLAGYAHRGSEKILAVVMGADSSAERYRKVAELLDLGFAEAPGAVRIVRPQFGARVLVASAPLPRARPGTPATGLEALAEVLVSSAKAATPPAATPVSRSIYAPRTVADLPLPRVRAKGLLAGTSRPGMPVPMPRPGTMAWAAEIGPYISETAALATLADIAARKIADASKFQVSRSGAGNGKPSYSLHLAGLSEGDAAQLCGVVSASAMACSVIRAAR